MLVWDFLQFTKKGGMTISEANIRWLQEKPNETDVVLWGGYPIC